MDDPTPTSRPPAEGSQDGATDAPGAAQRPSRNPDDWAHFGTWPRGARWVVFGLVALLVALAAAAAGVFMVVRQSVPEAEGTLEVLGLTSDVEVLRDDFGIPQIYADNLDDLMMAQGYLHAQERFYEMDVRRHVTSGRLSELFGEDTLDTDRFIRTLGWRRVAEQEFALLRPETRRALESYADGVNAYLADNPPRKIAVEYTLLGLTGLDYTPEQWEPADSLAWLKAMAWDLRGNMDDEVARVLTTVGHTPDQTAELFPPYSYANEPIVRQGAVVDGRFKADLSTPPRRRPAFTVDQLAVLEATQRAAHALPELLGHGEGLGSNSWVVDGAHSATGAPLLANDPHLGVSLPGVWMQMGLHCRTVGPDCPLQVAGFTFSGVPGVVIGHNAEIAWGFTNLGADVTDLYVERVRGETWRRGRDWLPLETRTEEITVRDADPVTITVRQTAHGPLVSDASTDLADVGPPAAEQGLAPQRTEADEEYAVALAWTALEPSTTADAILALDLAGDWSEFRAAAADFAVPSQNLIYADRSGNIGYQAPGRIPIRKSGNDGSRPVPGWKKRFDWTGDYIPFAALPRVLNPAEGFIVTANQAVVGPDYPYLLTGDWDRGYRSQRLRELLRAEGELSISEMLRLQLDDYNPMAPILTPYLLDIEDLPSDYYRDGQALLTTWDFHQPSESRAAAYYNATWRALLRLTFHDEVAESQWPDGGARWFAAVEQLLIQPTNPWWDDRTTDDIETRDDILRQAQLDARDELTALLGRDPQTWSWGQLHQLDLRNATLGESGLAPVEWLENREDYPVAGGGSIVNATSWNAAEGYAVTAAPSMRMVVSLADFDDSRWINLTGVSGHPASGHYVDQTQLWVDGETLPWLFSHEAVSGAAGAGLRLVPARARQ